MEKNKIILLIFLLISLSNCNFEQKNQQTRYKYYLQLDRKAFFSATNKNNWFNHFPKKIDSIIDFYGSPPATSPKYDCSNQTGVVYLVVKKNKKYSELVKKLIRKAQYKTYYNKENEIKINYKAIKNDTLPFIKYNRYFKDKLPIPYFEEFDLISNNIKTKDNVNHNIPNDCKVYVIEAKSGPDIWKFNCNEKRTPMLKKWTHGYSEGICISDESNIFIFWTILW